MTDQVRNEEVNADELSAAPRAVASVPAADAAEVTTAAPGQTTEQVAVTEATTPSAASESTATDAEATGASFTPVSDDQPQKPRRLKDLQPGMELEGKVTSIALYGVFVDVGVGRDGLVHISEMSDRRIETPQT